MKFVCTEFCVQFFCCIEFILMKIEQKEIRHHVNEWWKENVSKETNTCEHFISTSLLEPNLENTSFVVVVEYLNWNYECSWLTGNPKASYWRNTTFNFMHIPNIRNGFCSAQMKTSQFNSYKMHRQLKCRI